MHPITSYYCYPLQWCCRLELTAASVNSVSGQRQRRGAGGALLRLVFLPFLVLPPTSSVGSICSLSGWYGPASLLLGGWPDRRVKCFSQLQLPYFNYNCRSQVETSDLRPHWHMRMTSSKYLYRIRKTSSSGYEPLINRPPSLSKITCKYNYVDLYSSFVFVFFQKKGSG